MIERIGGRVMTFWDRVYELRKRDEIPLVWKVADLRPHLQVPRGPHKSDTVTSVPRNQSMTKDGSEIGNYIKRMKSPQDPMAWRIRPPKKSGKFQLIKDPSDDEATQDAELVRAKAIVESVLSIPTTDEAPDPLRGATYRYDDPYEPVALEDWEVLKEDSDILLDAPRWDITHEYAQWCVRSALNSGKDHIKSKEDVYAALDSIDFQYLFDTGRGTIDQRKFNDWHRTSVDNLIKKYEPRLNIGWAAKMIAIYFKTTCYIGGFGRNHLAVVIHPPIDNVLIENLQKQFRSFPDIIQGLRSFRKIGDMSTADYDNIIGACELIAQREGCTLFEVEQYFRPR